MPSGTGYSLVAAQRPRQPSSPDSDPRQLRRQLLEVRFERIEERQDKLEVQLTEAMALLAEVRDTVIQAKATFRAWLVAASAFWALLVALAGVLVKVL